MCVPSFGASCEDHLKAYAGTSTYRLDITDSKRLIQIFGQQTSMLKEMRVFDADTRLGFTVSIVPPKMSQLTPDTARPVMNRLNFELESIFKFYNGLGNSIGSEAAKYASVVIDLHDFDQKPKLRAYTDIERREIRSNFVGDLARMKFSEILAHEAAHLVLARWFSDLDEAQMIIHEAFGQYLTWLFTGRSESFLKAAGEIADAEASAPDEHEAAHPIFLALVEKSKDQALDVLLKRTRRYLDRLRMIQPNTADEILRDVNERF